MTPKELVLPKLRDLRKSDAGWTACCPVREDHQHSLLVREATDGRVVVECLAGCEVHAIGDALGLTVLDLFPTADMLERSHNSHNVAPSPARSTDTDDAPSLLELQRADSESPAAVDVAADRASSEEDRCARTRDGVKSWPDWAPFENRDLPKFPTDALPGPLRDWVEAESHATQTPPDLAGLLGLAVCSARIASRIEVEPRDGFREPTNLYVAVLLEPANRKSAVFADARRPLRELESELIEAARPKVALALSARRQSEARLQKLEKLAGADNDEDARREASELATSLAADSEPLLPRLLVDDVTPEKLELMLAEQGGRIASMSPEGGVFDQMAGQYSKNGQPQFGVYLKGHSGDALSSDRLSRTHVSVPRPALTCAYTIQPIVISRLKGIPAFRGRGLLARFLFAAPASWIGRREIAPTPVSELVYDAYRRTVRELGDCEAGVLSLVPDADELLQDWEREIEGMLAEGGQMELIPDWGGKLAGETVRIAAVIHCISEPSTRSISRSTFAAAIEIARYLIPHAEAVLCRMEMQEDPAQADARYVLNWIERRRVTEFTKRDVQLHGKRRFQKAADIDPALEELVRRGYIRAKAAEPAGPGRPSSPAYEVNPLLVCAWDR